MKRSVINIFVLTFIIFPFFLYSGCGGGDSFSGITSPEVENIESDYFQDPMEMPVSDDKLAEHMAGEVIVHYQPEARPEEIADSVGGSVIEIFSLGSGLYGRIKITGPVVEGVNNLKKLPQVIYAEPNYMCQADIVPDDTYYSYQYGPQNCSAEDGWDINTGSSSVVIAILDTGVNGLHSEFAGRMVGGYDFINSLALTGEENSDDYGHGTHVAGIAAATGNNNNGIAGVAWGCKIMPVKVLDEYGSGSYASIASGIVWASANGAHVINMSLGGSGYSQTLNDAIQIAVTSGTVVAVSMGNDYHAMVKSPASCQGVIAVGALNGQDEVTDFSTRGNYISIAGPGEDIYSTSYTGDYVYMSGTSMSCPFISGVCALILSQHSGITPEEVRSQLEETAVDLGDAGWDRETGWGKPDIATALGTLEPNKYGSITVDIEPDSPGLSVVLYDDSNNFKSATVSGAVAGDAYFYNVTAGSYIVKTFYEGTVKSSGVFSVSAGSSVNVNLNL